MKKQKSKGFAGVIVSLILIIALIAGGSALWHYRGKLFKTLPSADTDSAVKTTGEIKEICKDVNTVAELAEVQSNKDIIKIDYILPGLDTYTLNTVIYSKQDNKVLSNTDFGTADFSTDILNDGFYIAKSTEKSVDFYSFDGTKTDTVNIPADDAKGELSVSADGKYICFDNISASSLCLFDVDKNKVSTVCGTEAPVSFAGSDGDSFTVVFNGNRFVSVNMKTGESKSTTAAERIRCANENGFVIKTDEGYAVLNSDGETEYTVKTDKNDDEVLDFSDKKLVTASDNAITVYPFENGGSDKASVTSAALSGAVRYEFGEDVIRASFLSDGQLLVVTKSAGSGCRTFLYD